MTPASHARRRFLATAASVAFAARPAVAADSYTLRMSAAGNGTAVWNIVAARWGAAVARRSGGRLNIELYPNAQLAKERESIAGLTTGVVDLTLQSSVFLETLFPQLQVLTLPFMFKNVAGALRVIDGPIGADFNAQFESKGITCLAWGTSSFRQMETVGKQVRSPDDLKGLRYRVQGGAVSVAMVQALGAIPVTIDLSEVYTALSQHTIDVVDTTPEGAVDEKFYVIVKHVALTNHVLVLQPILASKSKIESLPSDLQRILREEWRNIAPSWRAAVTQNNGEAIATLKSNGVAVTDVDYPAFRKAMDPVYASLQAKLGGDLIQRVSRASAGP